MKNIIIIVLIISTLFLMSSTFTYENFRLGARPPSTSSSSNNNSSNNKPSSSPGKSSYSSGGSSSSDDSYGGLGLGGLIGIIIGGTCLLSSSGAYAYTLYTNNKIKQNS
jgi:hypothetical protein